MPVIRQQEIRARRVRKMKMRKLRDRFAASSSAAEKEKIVQKVARIAPWMTPEEFKKIAKA